METTEDAREAVAATQEALWTAHEAVRAAQEALRLAERAAGLEPSNASTLAVDEITVKQLNVVEDDGTLRMIIGNSTHGRVVPMRGRLRTHPGRNATAGILFVNDEGTECGGLQFGGRRGDDGPNQVGFLTFDDHEQNESFRIGLFQRDGVSERRVEFLDQPSWSLADFLDELEDAGQERRDEVSRRYFADSPPGGVSRIALCRASDGSASLVLRDGQGRDRIRLCVPSAGDPVIELIDETGARRALDR